MTQREVGNEERGTRTSDHGDSKFGKRTSGEFRLRPSVVKSTPNAIILRSDGGFRTTGKRPINRYRSSIARPVPLPDCWAVP